MQKKENYAVQNIYAFFTLFFKYKTKLYLYEIYLKIGIFEGIRKSMRKYGKSVKEEQTHDIMVNQVYNFLESR